MISQCPGLLPSALLRHFRSTSIIGTPALLPLMVAAKFQRPPRPVVRVARCGAAALRRMPGGPGEAACASRAQHTAVATEASETPETGAEAEVVPPPGSELERPPPPLRRPPDGPASGPGSGRAGPAGPVGRRPGQRHGSGLRGRRGTLLLEATPLVVVPRRRRRGVAGPSRRIQTEHGTRLDDETKLSTRKSQTRAFWRHFIHDAVTMW